MSLSASKKNLPVIAVRQCSFCGHAINVHSDNPEQKYCNHSCSGLAARTSLRKPVEMRFWAKVDKTGLCWLWTGFANKWGYGLLRDTRRDDDKDRRRCGYFMAHRYSWELHNGPIPEGLWVLHRCDTPACVNPDHLFLGTNQQNIADRHAKGRDAKGSQSGVSKLTTEQVQDIRISRKSGAFLKDIATKHKVTIQSVWGILNKKSWSHLPEQALCLNGEISELERDL